MDLFDGRSTGELFLATGQVEDQNPSDNLFMKAELVQADRLYTAKKQILESLGHSASQVSGFAVGQASALLGLDSSS